MYRHLAVNGIWRKTCFGRQLKYDCCMSTASYAAFLTFTRSLGTASDWQLAALNPEVFVMTKNDSGSDKKPDWMNPANDRKTPYTEEEIDAFVEDFILGLDEQLESTEFSAILTLLDVVHNDR